MTRQYRGSISLAAPEANESGRFSTFAGKRAFNARKGLLHGLGARQQLPAGLRQRISRRASCKKRRPGTRLARLDAAGHGRSEEHTSELQSLMRISYAVFCLKKKKTTSTQQPNNNTDIEHHKRNLTITNSIYI